MWDLMGTIYLNFNTFKKKGFSPIKNIPKCETQMCYFSWEIPKHGYHLLQKDLLTVTAFLSVHKKKIISSQWMPHVVYPHK